MSRRRLAKKVAHRRRTRMLLLVAGLGLIGAIYWATSKRPAGPQPHGQRTPATIDYPRRAPIPPHHNSEEAARPFPHTLPPSRFQNPAARAYRIAQQIPGILAQQPCYCWCDRVGHGSLLDCYASTHAAT